MNVAKTVYFDRWIANQCFFQIVDLIVTILEPSMEFVRKPVASVNAMMVFMVNYVIKVKAVQSLLWFSSYIFISNKRLEQEIIASNFVVVKLNTVKFLEVKKSSILPDCSLSVQVLMDNSPVVYWSRHSHTKRKGIGLNLVLNKCFWAKGFE